MTQIGERNPMNAMGSASRGFGQLLATVLGVDDNGIAQTADQFGRERLMNVQARSGSGSAPQVGEQWWIDRSTGGWTFKSRVSSKLPVAFDLPSLLEALELLGLVANGTEPQPDAGELGTWASGMSTSIGSMNVTTPGEVLTNWGFKQYSSGLFSYTNIYPSWTNIFDGMNVFKHTANSVLVIRGFITCWSAVGGSAVWLGISLNGGAPLDWGSFWINQVATHIILPGYIRVAAPVGIVNLQAWFAVSSGMSARIDTSDWIEMDVTEVA